MRHLQSLTWLWRGKVPHAIRRLWCRARSGGSSGRASFSTVPTSPFIARGDHARALASGLVLEAPDESVTLPIPVVTEARGVRRGRTTQLSSLAVKGQHTEEALAQLVAVAPPDTPIVCMQNGVENERRVLRRFPRTYAMCVMCPATHLKPGVIQAHSAPVSGLLDLGRYPAGVDDVAQAIADALDATTFQSMARPDIMRWKYRKLLDEPGQRSGGPVRSGRPW